MPKIAILGESGQLAQSLRALAWPNGCTLSFFGRQRPFSRTIADALGADLILNAAAYTAVDLAESEPREAAKLNVALPALLADVCRARDIPLIHVSSDYVFDGRKNAPYLETDDTNPLSVYGRTKLEGDGIVEQAGLRRWAVLRTSWVVSEIGETFPVKFLRRARQGEPLRVVDDQHGCPTAAMDLAHAMQVVGLRLMNGDGAPPGIFNICGGSEMSWHGFAALLLAAAEPYGIKRQPVEAIASAALGAPARRPAYSVLDCGKIAAAYRVKAAGIEVHLPRMVQAILRP